MLNNYYKTCLQSDLAVFENVFKQFDFNKINIDFIKEYYLHTCLTNISANEINKINQILTRGYSTNRKYFEYVCQNKNLNCFDNWNITGNGQEVSSADFMNFVSQQIPNHSLTLKSSSQEAIKQDTISQHLQNFEKVNLLISIFKNNLAFDINEVNELNIDAFTIFLTICAVNPALISDKRTQQLFESFISNGVSIGFSSYNISTIMFTMDELSVIDQLYQTLDSKRYQNHKSTLDYLIIMIIQHMPFDQLKKFIKKFPSSIHQNFEINNETVLYFAVNCLNLPAVEFLLKATNYLVTESVYELAKNYHSIFKIMEDSSETRSIIQMTEQVLKYEPKLSDSDFFEYLKGIYDNHLLQKTENILKVSQEFNRRLKAVIHKKIMISNRSQEYFTPIFQDLLQIYIEKKEYKKLIDPIFETISRYVQESDSTILNNRHYYFDKVSDTRVSINTNDLFVCLNLENSLKTIYGSTKIKNNIYFYKNTLAYFNEYIILLANSSSVLRVIENIDNKEVIQNYLPFLILRGQECKVFDLKKPRKSTMSLGNIEVLNKVFREEYEDFGLNVKRTGCEIQLSHIFENFIYFFKLNDAYHEIDFEIDKNSLINTLLSKFPTLVDQLESNSKLTPLSLTLILLASENQDKKKKTALQETVKCLLEFNAKIYTLCSDLPWGYLDKSDIDKLFQFFMSLNESQFGKKDAVLSFVNALILFQLNDKVIQYLRKYPKAISYIDSKGETPLHYAAYSLNEKIFKPIFEMTNKILEVLKIKNPDEKTPYDIIIQIKQEKCKTFENADIINKVIFIEQIFIELERENTLVKNKRADSENAVFQLKSFERLIENFKHSKLTTQMLLEETRQLLKCISLGKFTAHVDLEHLLQFVMIVLDNITPDQEQSDFGLLISQLLMQIKVVYPNLNLHSVEDLTVLNGKHTKIIRTLFDKALSKNLTHFSILLLDQNNLIISAETHFFSALMLEFVILRANFEIAMASLKSLNQNKIILFKKGRTILHHLLFRQNTSAYSNIAKMIYRGYIKNKFYYSLIREFPEVFKNRFNIIDHGDSLQILNKEKNTRYVEIPISEMFWKLSDVDTVFADYPQGLNTINEDENLQLIEYFFSFFQFNVSDNADIQPSTFFLLLCANASVYSKHYKVKLLELFLKYEAKLYNEGNSIIHMILQPDEIQNIFDIFDRVDASKYQNNPTMLSFLPILIIHGTLIQVESFILKYPNAVTYFDHVGVPPLTYVIIFGRHDLIKLISHTLTHTFSKKASRLIAHEIYELLVKIVEQYGETKPICLQIIKNFENIKNAIAETTIDSLSSSPTKEIPDENFTKILRILTHYKEDYVGFSSHGSQVIYNIILNLIQNNKRFNPNDEKILPQILERFMNKHSEPISVENRQKLHDFYNLISVIVEYSKFYNLKFGNCLVLDTNSKTKKPLLALPILRSQTDCTKLLLETINAEQSLTLEIDGVKLIQYACLFGSHYLIRAIFEHMMKVSRKHMFQEPLLHILLQRGNELSNENRSVKPICFFENTKNINRVLEAGFTNNSALLEIVKHFPQEFPQYIVETSGNNVTIKKQNGYIIETSTTLENRMDYSNYFNFGKVLLGPGKVFISVLLKEVEIAELIKFILNLDLVNINVLHPSGLNALSFLLILISQPNSPRYLNDLLPFFLDKNPYPANLNELKYFQGKKEECKRLFSAFMSLDAKKYQNTAAVLSFLRFLILHDDLDHEYRVKKFVNAYPKSLEFVEPKTKQTPLEYAITLLKVDVIEFILKNQKYVRFNTAGKSAYDQFKEFYAYRVEVEKWNKGNNFPKVQKFLKNVEKIHLLFENFIESHKISFIDEKKFNFQESYYHQIIESKNLENINEYILIAVRHLTSLKTNAETAKVLKMIFNAINYINSIKGDLPFQFDQVHNDLLNLTLTSSLGYLNECLKYMDINNWFQIKFVYRLLVNKKREHIAAFFKHTKQDLDIFEVILKDILQGCEETKNISEDDWIYLLQLINVKDKLITMDCTDIFKLTSQPFQNAIFYYIKNNLNLNEVTPFIIKNLAHLQSYDTFWNSFLGPKIPLFFQDPFCQSIYIILYAFSKNLVAENAVPTVLDLLFKREEKLKLRSVSQKNHLVMLFDILPLQQFSFLAPLLSIIQNQNFDIFSYFMRHENEEKALRILTMFFTHPNTPISIEKLNVRLLRFITEGFLSGVKRILNLTQSLHFTTENMNQLLSKPHDILEFSIEHAPLLQIETFQPFITQSLWKSQFDRFNHYMDPHCRWFFEILKQNHPDGHHYISGNPYYPLIITDLPLIKLMHLFSNFPRGLNAHYQLLNIFYNNQYFHILSSQDNAHPAFSNFELFYYFNATHLKMLAPSQITSLKSNNMIVFLLYKSYENDFQLAETDLVAFKKLSEKFNSQLLMIPDYLKYTIFKSWLNQFNPAMIKLCLSLDVFNGTWLPVIKSDILKQSWFLKGLEQLTEVPAHDYFDCMIALLVTAHYHSTTLEKLKNYADLQIEFNNHILKSFPHFQSHDRKVFSDFLFEFSKLTTTEVNQAPKNSIFHHVFFKAEPRVSESTVNHLSTSLG